MKLCPVCSYYNPDEANYCSSCGKAYIKPVEISKDANKKLKGRYDIFLISLLFSLIVSGVLIFVFHLPVFIMGLFLPFFWQFSPWKK